MTVRIRAHHLLCMLTYVGKGYTAAFTANYDRIVERLNAGEDILLVHGPDDICAPLLCESSAHCFNESVLRRDERAAHAVSQTISRLLRPGDSFRPDATMLAQMRQPGFDHEYLDKPPMILDILKKSPLNSTITTANNSQLLHQRIKRTAIRIGNTIFQCHQNGSMIM